MPRLAESRTRELRRAARGVIGRGEGYEPQPVGAAFRQDRLAGYYIDFIGKTTSPGASLPETLTPAASAQLALGWWDRSLAGERPALECFLRVCRVLDRGGEPAVGGGMLWPYSVDVPKYGLVAPWYSAMAQGQIASVYARAYVVTGESSFADRACLAALPILGGGPAGLVSSTPHGPVLEEAPSDPPSHILNGWIYALWGVFDVHLALGTASAGDAFQAGVACLRGLLPRYDAGWWSRYSLYPHPLADLAKPFYHRLHVAQLEVLYRLTGFPDLHRTAVRWHAYDTPSRRAAALAQKALFRALR